MDDATSSPEQKRCKKCGEAKPTDAFGKARNQKDGRQTWCKACAKDYRQANREALLLYARRRRQDPKARARQLELQRRWRGANLERAHEVEQKSHRKHYKKRYAAKRARMDTDPSVRENRNAQRFRRRQDDPAYRLVETLRVRLRLAVKNQGGVKAKVTLELVGCSPEDLRDHFERQFKPGMTWQNYGSVWEVDHIRPCCQFDLLKEEQQRACFHHTNLQPLFSGENRRKGGRPVGPIPATVEKDTQKAAYEQTLRATVAKLLPDHAADPVVEALIQERLKAHKVKPLIPEPTSDLEPETHYRTHKR